jgi:hypothetical protein
MNMPFHHDVDRPAALVTIRVRECARPNEAVRLARQLMSDAAIDASYSLLVIIEELTTDSTPEELRELSEILKMVGRKFRGRKAIVATQPGRVATARMVALFASTHDDVEAFTAEDAARAWLLTNYD